MEIWLDLEQTIISEWGDPVLVNTTKVREFLHSHGATRANVFSFAVWDANDQRHFRDNISPWLGEALDVCFNACPSLDEILRDVFWRVSGTMLDRASLVNEWGKARTFEEFIRVTRKSGDFILIDDVVEDTTTTRTLFNGHTQNIRLINVDNL